MKIKQKLLLGYLGFALLIGVVGAVALFYQNEIIENSAINRIKQAEKNFLILKERDTNALSATLEVILQEKALKSVYLQKNREKLYDYEHQLFEDLKEKYGITHFYFILPSGHCFVRMHNKNIYNDLITRFTFWKARDTKKIASGIELGKTAFALRVVAPYYDNKKLIGYTELSEEIDHFLKMLKGDSDNEFALVADKQYLDRRKWKSVRKVAGLRDNWDDIKKYVVITAPVKGKLEIGKKYFNEKNLEKIEKGDSILCKIVIKDQTFVLGGFKIMDVRGKCSGIVLSLINITDLVRIAQKAKLTFIGITIVLFLLALLISLMTSYSVFAPITKLKSLVFDVGRGNLDTKIELNTKDEIGDLAVSFYKMLKNLKKARGKLFSSKTYTDSIINNMGESLIVFNSEGLIKTVNKTAMLLLGYKEKEMLGQPIGNFFAGEGAYEETIFSKLIDEGSISNLDMFFLTKDAKKIPISITSALLPQESMKKDLQADIVCVIHDMRQIKDLITKLKNSKTEIQGFADTLEKKVKERTGKVEEAQAATLNIMEDMQENNENLARTNEGIKILYKELENKNKELKKLDQLKSEFISTVSHELRTPLSIVKESISLIHDKVIGEINDKQGKILGTAESNIDRLTRIIGNLLDISKIESGSMELKREKINIVKLVNDVISSFALKTKGKGLALKTNFAKEEILIYCDSDRLIEIFTNLIHNALKFTEKGFVEVSLTESKDSVECSVLDTGIGVSSSDLPTIFNKFQQFGRSTGTGERGTGLGLSIVKGIVELHKGKIWVESELGKGSIFTFTLPKRKKS